MVVATDFHYKWRPRIWDVRVETASDGLDLDNPLEGRAIRFYPNVFGRNTKGVPVLDSIMSSEEGARVAAAAEAEGRRLAYVGMTRARDTLIIALPPSGPSSGAWIGNFNSRHLHPTGDETPASRRRGHPLGGVGPGCRRIVGAGAGAICTGLVSRTLAWRASNPRTVSPSQADPVEGAAVGAMVEIGPRIAVHSDDMGKIGTALHAAIAAELVIRTAAMRSIALRSSYAIVQARAHCPLGMQSTVRDASWRQSMLDSLRAACWSSIRRVRPGQRPSAPRLDRPSTGDRARMDRDRPQILTAPALGMGRRGVGILGSARRVLERAPGGRSRLRRVLGALPGQRGARGSGVRRMAHRTERRARRRPRCPSPVGVPCDCCREPYIQSGRGGPDPNSSAFGA